MKLRHRYRSFAFRRTSFGAERAHRGPDPGLAIGAVAILLAIPTQRVNIALLVALAFAVVAAANLPALLYNLFWKRFNTMGATFSIYGGLIMAVLLVTFSPLVPAA